MKYSFAWMLIVITVLSGCLTYSKIQSTAVIMPGKSLVIGEGSHSNYNAVVVNLGPVPVNLFVSGTSGQLEPIGSIITNASQSIKVGRNQLLVLKNADDSNATVKIYISARENLSMKPGDD
jgi:hypothetical protein